MACTQNRNASWPPRSKWEPENFAMRLQVGEDYRVPHSSQSDVHTSLEHVSTGFRSHRYRYNGAAGGRYVGESPGPGVDWKRTLHIRLLWHLVTWFVALWVKMILPGTVPGRRASRFERETCRETRIYTTEHPTRETHRRVRAGTTTVVASWTWTPAQANHEASDGVRRLEVHRARRD